MKYFVNENGEYFEGDFGVGFIEVSKRTSLAHIWLNNQWHLDYSIAKKQALDVINLTAGLARAKYITVSIGQDATYLIKESQAREFKAAGYPADNIPVMVQAEIDAFGITAQAAADIVIATADQWIVLAASIEKIRRNAAALIDVSVANQSGLSAIETIKTDAVSALDLI